MPVGGEVTIELRVPSRVSQKDLRLWASWSDDTADRHEDEELLTVQPPRSFIAVGFA